VRVCVRIIAFAVTIAVGSAATGCGSSAPRATTHARAVVSATKRNHLTKRVDAIAPPTLVAKVGAKAITLRTLQHWVAIGNHGQIGAPEPPDYTSCVDYLRSNVTSSAAQTTAILKRACRRRYDGLLSSTLSGLIHAQWIIGEAADEGLHVDDAKLTNESALSGPQSEQVRQTLESTGETHSDLKFKLTLAQLSNRINQKLEREIPTITSARAAEYYARHKASFVVAERRDLQIIRTSSEAAAKQARHEIEAGTSFAALVARTSLTQPNTAHAGLLFGLQPNDWPEPPLSREIFHAKMKALSGPVGISLGFYIFEVTRRIPAHQLTLAEAQPEVILQLQRELKARVFSHYEAMLQRKWTEKTTCRPGYIVKYCKHYKTPETGAEEDPSAL
jgi:foldase protein PrsA